jgi:hypothetical protein
MKLPALTLLLFVLQVLQPTTPQNDLKGSIEGIVLRADDGNPLAGAVVAWTSSLDPPNLFNAPNPNPPTTTDSDGKFVLRDLRPATYRIFVTANGYVRQEYGQRVLNGTGKSLYLSGGQTVKDLSIAVIASATVSGRVLTDAGRPAVEALVQLVQVMYSPQGRIFRGVGMTNADDRGEYRLFGITPGRYYLVVGNARVSQTLAPGAGDVISVRMSQSNYGITFYPDSMELTGASILELKPASQIRADFTVKALQPTFRVRGRVIDGDTGQVASGANISITSQFNPQSTVEAMLIARNSNTTGGTFEFEVPPGNWVVRAEVRVPVQPVQIPADPATVAARSAAQAVRPFGQATVNVAGGDIDGLVITLRSGATIAGRVRFDDDRQLSAVPNLDRIGIGFQRSINGLPSPLVDFGGLSASRPSSDGTFQIAGVREGEFLLRITGLPQGFYVRSVRYGGEEVLNTPIRFSYSSSSGIEVVLSPGAAQASGTVVDAKSQPVSGIQAILIPDPPRRHRTELYRTVVTDQNGRFNIPNIPPGAYKVFSWEALEQNGYYDPDAMKEYESQGQEIRLEESANTAVTVRMIPSK